jgi:hypothetical protein
MLHDRSALIDQLRTHLTQQRYNPVVIHNQCRGAEHFLEYLAQRNDEVSGARRPVPFFLPLCPLLPGRVPSAKSEMGDRNVEDLVGKETPLPLPIVEA